MSRLLSFRLLASLVIGLVISGWVELTMPDGLQSLSRMVSVGFIISVICYLLIFADD